MKEGTPEVRNCLFPDVTGVGKLNGEGPCVRCETNGQCLFGIVLVSFMTFFI